ERRVDPTAELFESRALLELRGELDLLVAHGQPDPVGVIEMIAGTAQIDRADGQSPTPEPFTVE
ncbi:MAG TPA: hypothetical protein VK034_12190, partial [Enhygromyxa sp.]|nr:hypothetical protein [Enhygromyxa sp.]